MRSSRVSSPRTSGRPATVRCSGYGALVDRARAGGTRRSELAGAIPIDLAAQIGAVGSAGEIAARIAAYHEAGADHVGLVPSTATDAAGRGLLHALNREAVA